jgi:hypothetical protein
MAQTYVVYEVKSRPSKYGNEIWQIDLIGTEDRFMYRTYVDPNNRNYTNWAGIIDDPIAGYLLRNLKRSSKSEDLINADSKPIAVWTTSHRDIMLKELVEVWRERDDNKQGEPNDINS